MKTKKYCLLILVIVSSLIFLYTKASSISVNEEVHIKYYGNSTLEDLGEVSIIACVRSRTLDDLAKAVLKGTTDELDAACRAIRIDINDEVESLITRAGIKIIPRTKNKILTQNTPRLEIYIAVRKPSETNSLYAFTVRTELMQHVGLIRNPKMRTYTSTWWSYDHSVDTPNISFVMGFQKLRYEIEREVTKQIDQFIEDYLAANPKEQEKTTLSERLKMKKQESKKPTLDELIERNKARQ